MSTFDEKSRTKSRKRKASREASREAESETSPSGCKPYDTIFTKDLNASLLKSKQRTACKYDGACYQQNPAHFSRFSHPTHYTAGDITLFKDDTDRFLANTYTIYTCNNKDFSHKWNSEIGARRGEEKRQIYTALYDKYDTLIFYILANIALHLKEYIRLYGKDFFIYIFQYFESNDNTGLFAIEPESPIGKIFTKYAPKDRETNKIDYRLGNTTLSGIIKNLPEKRSSSGGRKKSNNKRSKSKRSKSKRSKSKRSKSKRSKTKNNRRKTHRKK